MTGGAVARRYARALYGAAEDAGKLDAVAVAVEALSELMREHAAVRHAFLNPAFALEERLKVIVALCELVKADKLVVRFMEVLADSRRLDQLPGVAQSLRRLADDRAGRVRAEVEAAAALNDGQVNALKTALETATGKTVLLEQRVEPALLGGVRVTVGSLVFDGSVRSHITRLAEGLRSTQAGNG